MNEEEKGVHISFNSDSRAFVKGEKFWGLAKRVAEDAGVKKRDFSTFLDIHKGRHEEYRNTDVELMLLGMEGCSDEGELKRFARRVREFEEIAEIFERAEKSCGLEKENDRLRKIIFGKTTGREDERK